MNKHEAPAREETSRLSGIKILDSLIIAALTALVIHITSIPKLETKIDALTSSLTEVKGELKKIKDDFYVPSVRSHTPAPYTGTADSNKPASNLNQGP